MSFDIIMPSSSSRELPYDFMLDFLFINSLFKLDIISSNKPFYTNADKFLSILQKSIYKVTKRKPVLSTTGGTSDARFIKDICPVIEFGSVGKTMHKIDEKVSIKDLETLAQIYYEIICNYKIIANK